ncbi:FAD/NAD(P)-binding domain-containing protein [Cylindrobasidium torrendii FP15055 ss-10]|uniref:Sulfide:quinone oxidoreductase, mitochondrial n=1 Tax=Cylindrobasidium torrendii FP15055 ss-10 TaxID=1314674 RepID=A0A0D7AUN9_9AGAR|nr:FAD/NAD(P)-binding domain-containing protein [Cylindrobasidium torrendii FP15055 ss-10]
MFVSRRLARTAKFVRLASTSAPGDKYKVVVVGAGSGGLSVANQIYNRFKSEGKALNDGDIALVDPAEFHYYQPGWTLVGSGLAKKQEHRRRLESLIPDEFTFVGDSVKTFDPASSSVTTSSGRILSYETLVVAAGIKTNWDGIAGLSGALADSKSGVSSIYSYDTCDKTWNDIEALGSGKAIFTQPAGVIKCAGAPQKIMWMARDRFRKTGRLDKINVDFYTGMPTMFSVKKYSDALNVLRQERNVGGYFAHNLTSIDAGNRIATFKKSDGSEEKVNYDFLHVAPPMGPQNFIKNSPLADAAGWVSVNQSTLQHTKPEYSNVFAIGDNSSLPTSKTAAAIIAQAPVLTENLVSFMTTGKVTNAAYNGYTSCPLLTAYGELMLAEFKYGLEPEESFPWLDQSKPNRLFYHFKKDLFPAAYWNFMVKGQWFGKNAIFRPSFN